MKASQTISGEIVLGNVLSKMMKIVMENAGAEKGFMILEENGRLLIEAEGSVGSDEISVLKSILVDSHKGLSSSVVNYVARTKETLILNNASEEGEFVNDPYIAETKPKSILCFALLHQGRLTGMLYLENNLSKGAFTPQRLEILNMLSSQIAISIDNAKLYENLEDKVKERTEELRTSMNELKRVHNIAERDMLMAVNVQTSLFPKKAPETPAWDIAFIFKPMSGVSGDFYDFYENDGELKGLALMDVSGHGIASGLITMIARSAFDRHFRSGDSEGLNHVLENANKELISAKGNVDNYLSGVLLRFSGDTVEYVNAGHPDIIYKKSSSGKTGIVRKEGRDIKGLFLGLEATASKFDVLKFKVSKGDTLLLFTDCLTESQNSDGKEFDFERVIASLQNYILNDFYGFMKSKPLEDDLTAVVLRRKI
jgi:serine phosphatase RsbU (regulator of sigma subunit)